MKHAFRRHLLGDKRTWLKHSVVVIFYCLLTCLLFWPVIADMNQRLVGLGADPIQKVWFINWTTYALTHGTSPFITHAMNSPVGVNLMWNNSLPVPGTFLLPVTLLFGGVASLNLLQLLAFVASASFAYWMLYHFTSRALPSSIGGMLYGFSPFMVAESMSHVTFTLLCFPPLLVILLDTLLRTKKYHWYVTGLLIGGAVAAQILTSEELLTMCAFACVIAGVCAFPWVLRRIREDPRYVFLAVATALATAVIIAGYPLYVQLRGPGHITDALQPFSSIENNLFAFVIPTSNGLLTTHLLSAHNVQIPGSIAEEGGYLGIPWLVVLAGIVWRSWRTQPVIRVLALVGLICSICSLGAYLHVYDHTSTLWIPWRLARYVPIFRSG